MTATGSAKRYKIILGAIQAGYWSLYAFFGMYGVTLALDKGFPESMAGLFSAFFLIGGFAGQFLWGTVSDKLRTNKKTFLLGILFGAIFQTAMYFSKSPVLYIVFFCLFGLCIAPMGAVLDTWALRIIDNDMTLFGRIRSCGTAGFAFSMLILGFIVSRFGFLPLLLIAEAVAAVTIALALSVPDVKIEKAAEKSSSGDFKAVFKNRKYVLLLVILFLLGMSLAPISNLKILILKSIGRGAAEQGLDSFIGNAAQFVFFLNSGIFDRISIRACLFIDAAMYTVGALLTLVAAGPALIYAGSVFTITGLGLATYIGRRGVFAYIDPKFRTTATGICDACVSQVSGAIALVFAGSLASAYGVKSMIALSAAFPIIGLVILAVNVTRHKTQ